MRYTTLLTYKGSEDYSCKTREGSTKLYIFENEYGEVEKVTLKEDPNLEIDAQCKVTVKKESKYYKKSNTRSDYLSYESVKAIHL